MLFRLLGSLEVTVGDRPIRIGTGRQRDVLIMLLLHRNAVVSSERLIDSLWGEHPPATAVKVLQNSVGQLRRALDDREARRLQTRGHGYLLRVEDAELDVVRFERLVREGGRALASDRPADAAALLREALGLWRGPPLADVAYETFAQAEITRLEEQHAIAIERRIDADLALGAHSDLVAELDGLIDQHPLREHLRGQRMLALYRCGRQAEALETYREGRRLLVDEVGVEPGTELRGLHDAILRQDPALELKPPELPRELDPDGAPALVGRDREMQWLRTHWDEARYGNGRLIALTGEPGMGKTRLAAELAGEVHRAGCAVLHAAGAASSEALVTAIGRARDLGRPALLVIESAGADGADAAAVRAAAGELESQPILVLLTADEPSRLASLNGAASLALGPLDARALTAIARSYAPDAATPAAELAERSGGVPGRAHALAAERARVRAERLVSDEAERTAGEREGLRRAELRLAGSVAELQSVRERAERHDTARATVVCPYKGLASFDRADAAFFFGRERLVAEMVARLVGSPLLGVVGPSGSGKSSVVRAGLLAELANGVLPGSEGWTQAVLRPGEHPMAMLRRATAEAAPGSRLLIAVDQFEETFTICRDDAERSAFIGALIAAAGDRLRGAAVVLAVRADFYGRCSEDPALAALLAANQVLVGPMQPDELRRAIERPAHRAGLAVEAELADALLADTTDEPGALPLLSTALLELWQRRDGNRLRLAAYERTGGVRGAVGRLAETAYKRLDGEQQTIARRMLLRLAGDEGVGTPVRRRAPLAELEADRDDQSRHVLEVLSDSRLVTVSEGSAEVAHEALLHEWPRLRAWLQQDAEGRRLHRHLIHAAAEWSNGGRDRSELYQGARLASALEWRAEHEPELNTTEQQFLDASRTASERARRRIRLALAGVLGVARRSRLPRRSWRSISGDRRGPRPEQPKPNGSALRRSTRRRWTSRCCSRARVSRSTTRRPPGTTCWRLCIAARRPSASTRASDTGLAATDLAPGDESLVVGDNSGAVIFVDPSSRRRLGAYRSDLAATITELASSPDGTRLAAAGDERGGAGFAALFDRRTRRHIIDLETLPFFFHVERMAFSSDSRQLTVQGNDSGGGGGGGGIDCCASMRARDTGSGAHA